MAETNPPASDSEKTPLILVKEEKPDLRKKEQPLVDLKVTNPVVYLKKLVKRIIANEGIDLRFRIRPLTATAIALVVVTVSYGLGRVVLPFKIPFFEYATNPSPTPTPDPFRETAFLGTLHFNKLKSRYYLTTSLAEAITLEVPKNVDLSKLVGKRIFATGRYNSETMILVVGDISDLEILTASPSPIPTTTPIPTPSPSPAPTAAPTLESSPTLTPESTP